MAKLFKVRPGLWKRVRQEIYDREKGICQKCGQTCFIHFLPVREDPTRTTDKPTWTIHHIIPKSELARRARMECSHLSGQKYIEAIRNGYTRLATDPANLELRCDRDECTRH